MPHDPLSILGLIGTIEAAFHWGKEFIAICKAFANADSRLHESIVRVEACWLKIQMQLELIRRLEPQLEDWHKTIQQQILEILLHKLQATNTKLSGIVKRSDALLNGTGEGVAADAIEDLEVWQNIFDPSWFFMMKLAASEVDQQLYAMSQRQLTSANNETKAVIPAAQRLRRALNPVEEDATKKTMFLNTDGLITENVQGVAYSPVRIARRAVTGQLVLLDPITCTSRANVNSALRDIRDFARRLQQTDPFTFGLPQCKGILVEDDSDGANKRTWTTVPPTGLSFVFRMPPTHPNIQSEHDSLWARFDLARQLVKAVSYVHLYEFVHKNIRPETVLILGKDNHRSAKAEEEEDSEAYSETAVLVGFDNLYRYPHRQGRTPATDYDIRHDIYSVGVCLLEIGLWESFVKYDKVGEKEQALHQFSLLTTNLQPPSLGSNLKAEGDNTVSGSELLKSPERAKARLLQLTRGTLRPVM
ncbi:hypothetical protein V8C42DRAFT_356192 [Trichoderma barbatum]